jgi:hypothetical protein
MDCRKLIMPFAVAAIAHGCGEPTGPPAQPPPEIVEKKDAGLHTLRWGGGAPQFVVVLDGSQLPVPTPPTGGGSPASDFRVSFSIPQASPSTLRVDCVDDNGRTSPFLDFSVDENAIESDSKGRPVALEESVQLTLTIDTSDLSVQFEPYGVRFRSSQPAVLKIWYTEADGDLDGDGDRDAQDTYIQQNLLGLWDREAPWKPLKKMDTSHSIGEKRFTAGLLNLSGYAVSY